MHSPRLIPPADTAEAPAILGAVERNNVIVTGGDAARPMIFAHGFGCSHEAWRDVAPRFIDSHRVITFDQVGAGASNLAAYDRGKYDSLHGYADDLIEIIDELNLTDIVYVGHSVSCMIGVLASIRRPELFGALILIGSSPRYVDAEGYTGGFSEADIEALLDSLDANYLGWSAKMAPAIAGNAERPEVGERLVQSFCSIDPQIASQFARVTFLSDSRDDLPKVTTPTLVLQSSDDILAPLPVGHYVHEHIRGSQLVVMTSRGHMPNLSNPDQLVREIRDFLS
ncbi:hydrolase [Salinibacterium xinjiangense]|uniref:Sigma-B regulation protein RsbQ n=1 Tax=Salinibacterium xinjiangense TaxID=386302 RepID=A0A2C8YL49_9MICO|nr:alpha/beta hydrolase [Salinibacterium xinjiangense]GGK97664.1 hydrolase [Salinibacterium xinjiangense]SOE51107.1 sigma-B regulation protein RsbQ [Salinibacterium xinjiangense]